MLPRVAATAYLTPLREGGSLPGLVEADDLGTYVVKFTGAGQGPKALVAEIVVGELARALGIGVPELALIEVDPEIGRREPDQEVQDLIGASTGVNLAMDFLPGSVGYDRHFEVPAADAALHERTAWLSVADATELVRAAVEADLPAGVDGFVVAHGVSANRHNVAELEQTRRAIGYAPVDDAWQEGR